MSKNNVIDFAKAKEANKVAKGDLGPFLRELADYADNGEIRNVFIAWTMKDGTVHHGHAMLGSAIETMDDDQLRLLGLLRIAERGFLNAMDFEQS